MDTKPREAYPPEVLQVIELSTFSQGRDVVILGSNSLKTIQYAADVDCFESTTIKGTSKADALERATHTFQTIIRSLLRRKLTYITDIKLGSIEDWIVIPKNSHISNGTVLGYDYDASVTKLKELYSKNVINSSEYASAFELLKPHPTPHEFLIAKDAIRFNIVRWKPHNILQGFIDYRTKRISVEEAMSQPAIIKLDLVMLIDNNRFIEYSCIYELIHKGIPLNNFGHLNITQALREDILEYTIENNPFKAAKRMFALARFDKRTKVAERFLPIFNSDLGRLYQVIVDIDTLLLLKETQKHLPAARIRFELAHLPSRLTHISSISSFVREERQIIMQIHKVIANPTYSNLEELVRELKSILVRQSKKVLKAYRLYPPSAYYLP